MAAHAHEDAECEEFGDDVRAAVAHEGRRGARDGEESHVHPDVHGEMAREHDGDACAEEDGEIIAAVRCDGERAQDDERVEAE